MTNDYDVVVVGSGHAGCEAALATARMGQKTLLLTLNLDSIGFLACNPSIGGTAKGHLVCEIDALGGQMGINADKSTIQRRMLNSSKGYAVQSLRVQADKNKYHTYLKQTIENETYENIKNELIGVKQNIDNLLKTADFGRAIKDGTKILIFGKTNAGKSSLLNSLLAYDRAIVTDIQGTTRDTIEETFLYKGFKFVLIDTAGIRKTDNLVEEIGINRSKEMLKSADIVLFVVDGSKPLTDEDMSIAELLADKNVILCVNKCDLKQVANIDKLNFENKINISCENGLNIESLKEKLYSFVTSKNVNSSGTIITNSRHIFALKQALENIDLALDAIAKFVDLSLVSIDIKNVWLNLGDITGNSDNEKIIDDIFNKFCVGK